MTSQRPAWRRVALRVALAFAALLGLLVVPAPVAAQNDSSGSYTPCESDERIDVLVMMDASGSLNAPGSGIDPQGRLRTRALTRFRSELAQLLSELPDSASVSVQIGLWRFESDAEEIAGFAVPRLDHPSDEAIRRSLGDLSDGRLAYRTNHTNYLVALRAAQQAFEQGGRPDACRLLLFFTDGLHDPTGRMSAEQAEQLRSEVCTHIKPSFERAGIDTYAILLGFGGDAAGRPVEAEMRTATMQVLRALTGDADSHLVRGLPYGDSLQCEQWSDEQPADRDGAISGIAGLDDLALELLQVVDVAANSLVEWTNCGAAVGAGTRSAPLPAGRYIDQIVAYPQGAAITGYETVQADGTAQAQGYDGTGPLRLNAEDFGDYAAGWTLEFATEGDGGLGVACFIKHAEAEQVQSTGTLTSDSGAAVNSVERSVRGADAEALNLQVSASAPAGLCEAGPFEWPDQRVLDWYCRDGNVVFEMASLECQDSLRLTPLVARFEPPHAEAVYSSGDFIVEARIVVDGPGSVLYDCFGGPALDCGQNNPSGGAVAVVMPDSKDVPREPLRAATDCVLHPPERGIVELAATWSPDASRAQMPGELAWHFDADHHDGGARGSVDADGTVLRLSGDEGAVGVPLRFVTAEEITNGDWRIAGSIDLVPSWDPGEGAAEVAGQAAEWTHRLAQQVHLDQSYLARSNSATAWWITLLLVAASLLLSYLLICLALVNSMTLPDAGRFWLYRAELPVERSPRGRLQFAGVAPQLLGDAPAAAVRGTKSRRGRGKRTVKWQSGDLAIQLRRSPWFWLPGLVRRGGWSAVRTAAGVPLAASPRARRVRRRRLGTQAAASCDFTRLEVVEAPGSLADDGAQASVWVALPRSGRGADLSRIDPRRLDALLDEAGQLDNEDRRGERAPDSARLPGAYATRTPPDADPASGSSVPPAPDGPPPRRR